MSVPTFNTYQPPGVYVASTNTPIVTPTGVPVQTLCLVGPAIGYRTAVQSLLAYASTPFNLSFTGVFTAAQAGPPPIAAPLVTLTSTNQVLTAGVDYALTVVPDPSGNSALAVTQVTRVPTSPILTIDGLQITVAYNYADITYYQPQVFNDPQSVINAYGPMFLTTAPTAPGATQIANPLSYACQVAFQNGANTIVAIALNPASGSLQQQFIAAYNQVQTTYGITIMVPVWTDDLTVPGGSSTTSFALQLAQDLNSACVLAASGGFPRIGVFGLPRLYSESTTSIPVFCSTVNSKRLVLAYPEIIQIYNSVTGQSFNGSGCYMAAALGGILSSLPVSTGLTGQQVSGFTLTQAEIQQLTQAFMNTLAGSGACIVFQNYLGQLIVRHGLTTAMSALNTREISLVRQDDALLVAVQQGMQSSGLIGSPITPSTVATVQSALTGILQQQLTLGAIQGYQNISVIEQQYPNGDPTLMACTFQYLPALPLNYVTVIFSISLTTGQISTQSVQNALAP